MSNINEQKAPVVARGPDGKIGAILIDTRTGKAIPNSWVPKDDPRIQPYLQPGGKDGYRLDPQKFREKEEEKARARAIPSSVPPGSFNISPPGSRRRKEVEAQIVRDNKAREEAQARAQAQAPDPASSGGNGGNRSTVNTGSTASAARKAELKAINNNPTLSNYEKWKKANPRLAAAERIRAEFKSAGKSPYSKDVRKEVSRVLYNPGTTAYYGESYDIVLDYLLSEGHADTVEEAHYVMLQLDSEYIQSIVENVQGGPILPGEKGKTVYEKGKEPKPTGAQLPKV